MLLSGQKETSQCAILSLSPLYEAVTLTVICLCCFILCPSWDTIIYILTLLPLLGCRLKLISS